jgi:MoxR-like ATPase
VTLHALGEALKEGQAGRRRVVLIDEIDKAPRDFPNDLLNELDQWGFTVRESGARYEAVVWPIVVITSNSERQLPDAFLRRCVFCYIPFPDASQLAPILAERVGNPDLSQHLCDMAVQAFLKVRQVPDLDKPPATAELLGWVRVLIREGVDLERLASSAHIAEFPALGVLLKTQLDYERVARSKLP